MSMKSMGLQIKQEASILSEIKRADGTKLLAGVGYPMREYQDSDLPYAVHNINRYPAIYHNIIICRVTDPVQDEEKIFLFLESLRLSPFINWVGRLKYERTEGQIYCIASCMVETEEG